jgi:hypothetical protein
MIDKSKSNPKSGGGTIVHENLLGLAVLERFAINERKAIDTD